MFGGMVAALLLFVGYGTAFSQGTLNFATSGNPPNGEVFQHDGITPADTTFSALLLGSTTGLGGSFAAISTVQTFLTGGLAGYIYDASNPITPGPAAGTTYYYEIEVWTALAGSYANAQGV